MILLVITLLVPASAAASVPAGSHSFTPQFQYGGTTLPHAHMDKVGSRLRRAPTTSLFNGDAFYKASPSIKTTLVTTLKAIQPDGSVATSTVTSTPKSSPGSSSNARAAEEQAHSEEVETFAHPETHSFSFVYGGTNTTFEVELKRNDDLFGAQYAETAANPATGEIEARAPAHMQANAAHMHCHYVGRVVGDPASTVSASTCVHHAGGITARVLGHGHDLVIRPHPKHADGGEGILALHTVEHTAQPYEEHAKEAGLHGKSFCGLTEHEVEGHGEEEKERGHDAAGHGEHRGHNHDGRNHDGRNHDGHGAHDVTSSPMHNGIKVQHRARKSSFGKKFVEVLLVNDAARSASFDTLEVMGLESVSIMNQVTAYYKNQAWQNGVEVQVVLTAMHTLGTVADPGAVDPWVVKPLRNGEIEPSQLLDAFNKWASEGQQAGTIPRHDNHVLLSGSDFKGSTLGLAGFPAMCEPQRSGSVNQANREQDTITSAVVAHEMGHNLLFRHDGSNGCGSAASGHVMQPVVGGSAPTSFSDCSVADLTEYLSDFYPSQQCLDNSPTTVFGDPVCRNGFVEEGEECDCGAADCSGIDPCCDGATCEFVFPGVCSSNQPCCESCQFVAFGEEQVCRGAANQCDIAEYCPGGTAECPNDVFHYPGTPCTANNVAGSFVGKCFSKKCHSLEETCENTVSVATNKNLDADSEICTAIDDECKFLSCHVAGGDPFACDSALVDPTNSGLYYAVPDGTPCMHPSDDKGVRTGFCYGASCQVSDELAAVPTCGNGGVDFGEDCDCGATGVDPDGCCNCDACILNVGAGCSSAGWADGGLCCQSSCKLASAGVTCRSEQNECDAEEVCSGASPACPSDMGAPPATACTTAQGEASTCYAGECVDGLDQQCTTFNGGVAQRSCDAEPSIYAQIPSECTKLTCSPVDEAPSWNCLQSESKQQISTVEVDGEESITKLQDIWLSGAIDGTAICGGAGSTMRCRANACVADQTSCPEDSYLETGRAECVSCSEGCDGCVGPSLYECTACKFGALTGDLARGFDRCPISAEQCALVAGCTRYDTAGVLTAAAARPVGPAGAVLVSCLAAAAAATLLPW